MTTLTHPILTTPHPLPSAPHTVAGSTTYTHSRTHTTLHASAAGPQDPARRADERPLRAHLEVVVRPAAGAGGPRERHAERRVQACLGACVDGDAMPRQGVQVVLQVVAGDGEGRAGQGQGIITMLPHLINAGVLALLDGNVPLRRTCAAVLVVRTVGGEVVVDPGTAQIEGAGALHAFAFAVAGEAEMLMAESEGVFGTEEWEEAATKAREACCGEGGLEGWIRGLVSGARK